MAYQALYRKFRPQTFDEVKGQDAIVTTLKNEIVHDRIGHAYLFNGTRGTGKTTCAKIFARAVNCETPLEDGSPCGTCESCRAILEGRSLNVMELDAASNNGVDNVREIIDSMAYPPTQGKYRVYIIDEAHMLSKGAFNALLKSLEEPPEYVIFILATTEVNRLPITILSRCQRYDFHRIRIETIAKRLREIVEREGVAAEDRALSYIAKTADGSMRDALSLLDQCMAFYLGEELTYDRVLSVLGAVDAETFSKLLGSICEGDVRSSVGIVEQAVTEGRDLRQFILDFTWYLRNLLLLKAGDDTEDILEMSSDNLARLKEEAELVSEETVIRYIRILSDLSNRMTYAVQKRVLAEIAVIQMCRPQMETDHVSLVARIEQLEHALENGAAFSAAPAAAPLPAAASREAPVRHTLPEALPEDLKKLVAQWKGIVGALSGGMKQCVREALPTLDDTGTKLLLVFESANTAYRMLAENEKNRKEFEQTIADFCGKTVPVEYKVSSPGHTPGEEYEDVIARFAKKSGIQIPETDRTEEDLFLPLGGETGAK